MNDDAALLRSYAEKGSESAFTALVQRHLDLVYAAALRRVGGDAHLAADVAQQVFITLARQAGRLAHVNVLGAWLHTATRNAAVDLVISEQRRKIREQASVDPALAQDDSAPEWERLKPVLDAAIDELAAPDREAVVLRFLEQKPFGEIGAALKVSADAARMRTERALDKLRIALAKRGITSTAAAVGAIVSSQSVISAPTGLVASVARAALTSTGVGTFTVFLASLMKFKAFLAGVGLLSVFGAGAYFGLMAQLDVPSPPAPETPQHSRTIDTLRRENLTLWGQIDALRATAPAATPSPSAATTAAPPISPSDRQKARTMLNTLRQLSAARDQFMIEKGRPPESYHDLVGPDKYVGIELKPVAGEDYALVSLLPGQPMTVRSPSGISATFNPDGSGVTHPPQEAPIPPTRRAQVYLEQQSEPVPVLAPLPPQVAALGARLAPAIQKAMDAYVVAHGAKPSENEAGSAALIPYFPNPQEGADYVEFLEGWKQAGRK